MGEVCLREACGYRLSDEHSLHQGTADGGWCLCSFQSADVISRQFSAKGRKHGEQPAHQASCKFSYRMHGQADELTIHGETLRTNRAVG